MQDKEKPMKFSKVKYTEYKNLIRIIAEMFRCDEIDLNSDRLFRLESDYSTICYFEGELDYVENIYKILSERLGLYPYCLGIPILIERKDKKIIPLIPLEKFLKKCKNIIKLNGKIAEKFTYGAEIEITIKDIVSYVVNVDWTTFKRNCYYLTYNENGIFIGFAQVRRLDGRRIKIIPVLDIGWYLRKGG